MEGGDRNSFQRKDPRGMVQDQIDKIFLSNLDFYSFLP